MTNEAYSQSPHAPRSDRFAWIGAALLFAGAAVVFLGTNWMPRALRAAVPFELHVSDVNGTLRIRWDTHAADVSRADNAVLEVYDGSEHYQYPVSLEVLNTGALDYLRKSEDVTAVLILYKDGQEIGRRMVRSVSGIGNI